MAEQSDLERDLRQLEANLRKLETEYNMYFAGTLPRPPMETRARVEKLFRRYDRAYIQSYADRFRLTTLQARFSTFADLWDRGPRAREEGRPGPVLTAAARRRAAAPPRRRRPRPRTACCAWRPWPTPPASVRRSWRSTIRWSRRAARPGTRSRSRSTASPRWSRRRWRKLREAGSGEVAFRVAVKDGQGGVHGARA